MLQRKLVNQNSRKRRLPFGVVILDLLGTLLLATGIYGMLGGDDLLFAKYVDLQEIAVALVIVGALMMTPLIFVMVRRAAAR